MGMIADAVRESVQAHSIIGDAAIDDWSFRIGRPEDFAIRIAHYRNNPMTSMDSAKRDMQIMRQATASEKGSYMKHINQTPEIPYFI